MHHANLLAGTMEWALGEIPEEERASNPDISVRSFERMALADAHALIYDAGLRPLERPYRTFILNAQTILPEAQNALLKLFEDPSATVRFFLVVPREDALLSTLRSRFNLFASQGLDIDTAVFEEFYKGSYKERLALIAKKLDAEDHEWARTLVAGCAVYAERARNPELIADVLSTEMYLGYPGASKKMLLEHLALSVPQK